MEKNENKLADAGFHFMAVHAAVKLFIMKCACKANYTEAVVKFSALCESLKF